MKQYLDLLRTVLEQGTRQANRTGVDTLFIPGAMMQFDLGHGFPIVTTKRLNFDACKGEMLGHLRGYSSADKFRELGCNVWDANANKNKEWLESPHRKCHDDLGRIYGVQWRRWRSMDADEGYWNGYVDQVKEAVTAIMTNPTSRRIIINAWCPDEMAQMALPPCHVLYQFLVNVERQELNLCMYQRSCDMFLGVPFNISGAALLLSLVARATGYVPRMFTHFLADAHIYVNHVSQVEEQLGRTSHALPMLSLDVPVCSTPQQALEVLTQVRPADIELHGYMHEPSIKAEMAV